MALWLCALCAILASQAAAQAPVSISGHPDRASPHYDNIEAALAKPCSFDYIDTPLNDVVAHLANQSGVTFVLSKKIEDVGVRRAEPITKSLKSLSLKSALRLLLSDLNLTYMVQNECIVITTTEDAQNPENLETRVYPVKDLVEDSRAQRGNASRYDFDPLLELIASSIEPDSWQEVGGPGSISGSDSAAALVISSRRDVHDRVTGLLTSLRRAKAVQGLRGSELEPAVVSRPYTAGSSSLSRPLPTSGGRK